jgi:hypothetical protein
MNGKGLLAARGTGCECRKGMQEMCGCRGLVALSGMYLSSTRVCVCVRVPGIWVHIVTHVYTCGAHADLHISFRISFLPYPPLPVVLALPL